MASQLDQLLAYLERPGVREVVLSVGKPISMLTEKGVMNVTARNLSAEQLANIVRGTPIEALIADDSETQPVELTFGARSARVHIGRGEDTRVILQRIIVEAPPEEPPEEPAEDQAAEAPPPEKARRSRTSTPPRTRSRRSQAPENTESTPTVARTKTARPAPDVVRPPAKPVATSGPSLFDVMDSIELGSPGTEMELSLPEPPSRSAAKSASIAPPISETPADLRDPFAELTLGDLPEPEPVRKKSPTEGPKGPPAELELPEPGAASQAFDMVPSAPPRPKASGANALRINVGLPKEDASGIIPLDRPPPVPLVGEARTLDALGLPPEIPKLVSRERQLVLITAPHGHGKTSTLAALLDRIDRSVVSNVVSIDELRDREAVDLALTAAESGYLVLATVASSSAQAAIDIMLDHYPGMAHGRVRTRLIASVGLVIAKRLPPTPTEIVIGNALKTLLGG